ncbi:MFS transporter [Lacrimispora sp.]|uniref:MFS transporter n=1 Tax=Lacrimispora sp. TaxID=2719234 RepID=UPI00289C31A2|nr:MFS transporter [Lacrimispora sp.]
MKSKIFNSNFVFLVLGQTFSLFGTVVLKFTISLLILDLTGSAALFGAITAISYLPPIFLSPFAGILADRMNKRSLMVGMDCFYSITAILLALSLSVANVLIPIAVAMIAMSVVSSFETPVVQSSIPLIQDKDTLIRSNAVVSQVNMLSNLLGPLVAGALYALVSENNLSGVRMISFCCAVFFLGAALLEILIKIPKTQQQAAKNNIYAVKQDLFDGVQFIVKEKPYVCNAILLNAAFVLLIQPLITIGAPFIIRVVLNLNSILNGTSQAVMGAAGLVGGLLAGLIAPKFKTSKIYQLFWIMGVSMACFGISFLFNIPSIVSYVMLVICGAIIFMSASIAGIYIMSAIQRNVPDNMLGRVMSFYGALLSAALPIGLLLYGYLYERFVNRMYLVMCLTAILILAVGHAGKKTYQKL